jgi:hypothetical protein
LLVGTHGWGCDLLAVCFMRPRVRHGRSGSQEWCKASKRAVASAQPNVVGPRFWN